MSLPADLLEQAQHLTRRERGRPKQASLRRGVSTAYYALFHLLIDEAAAQAIPASIAGMRSVAKRSVNHSEVRKVCVWFAPGGNLPDLPVTIIVPADLCLVAKTFVNLLQQRHEADYDADVRFSRADVTLLVKNVEEAFAAWNRIRATDEGRIFLSLLSLTDRWRR